MMNLSNRQKVLIPVLILVVLVLIWQVYRTYGAFNSDAAGATAATQTSDAGMPRLASKNSAGEKQTEFLAPTQAANLHQQITEVKHKIKLTNSQEEYIELVSKYQRLQLEKMIAQNNQAIAQAKLQAAKARSKLSQVMGDTTNLNNANANVEIPKKLQLVYTGQSQGEWTATLKKGKELVDVEVGNRLNDGARVMSINDSKVVLQNGETRTVVDFSGEHQISAAAKTPVAASQATAAKIQAKQIEAKAVSPSISKTMPQKAIASKEAKVIIKTKPAFSSSLSKQSKEKTNTQAMTSILPQAPLLPTTTKLKTKVVDKFISAPKIAPIANKGRTFTKGEHKILSMNPVKYTVQLIGSHHRRSLDRFAAQNNLIGRSHEFKTTFQNKPWYALVFGEYNSISEALTAINELPDSAKINGPFVRRVRIIQNEIKLKKVV